MKKIIISDDRKLNISNVVIGYLQENKIEKLEFEIPKEYESFGRKACFDANGNTFTKTFDNITGNTITLTRDITQYQDLFMTIAFFKIEDEDEIIARTSTLHILIQDAVICDDDIKPDDPKVVILDNLITKVTNLDNTVTKNEEIRENNETTRQQNETTREENEINRVNSEANREKAEESRKKAELERVSNENTRQSNEEERKVAENERVSNENAREEYINNLKAQVENGDFDGADFNYKWDGTKLGVKNSKETTYQFVELKGQKGDKGDKGDNGDTGNGIQNIEKVSTVGNVDTYAINYTDGTQTTFDVTNGEVTKEQLDEVDNKAKNTRNELERVKNDVLETGTDTDTFIHLEDSAMAEYQELSVDGVCKQETTTGSNLCNLNVPQASRVTYNEDGTITINGTGNFSLKYDKFTFKANTDYYMKWELVSGTITGFDKPFLGIDGSVFVQRNIFHKFSFTSDKEISSFWVNNASAFTNAVIKIWFSASQSDYEQYTGGQPSPSPDYPQPISTIENSLKITSCNKNLFDKDNANILNAVINTANNTFVSNSDTKSLYLKVQSNTTYTISKISSKRFVVATSENAPKIGDTLNNVIKKESATEATITTGNNEKYLVIYYYLNGTDTLTEQEVLDSIQIEKGTTATPYEQHLETQITANLPEGEFIGKINDTYKDTLKVEYNEEDGQYHLNLYKNVGKVVLDGADTGIKTISSWDKTTLNGSYQASFSNLLTKQTNSEYVAISNYFDKGLLADRVNKTNIIYTYTDGVLRIATNVATTKAGFLTWLSTHNTEVYYVLATPYEVDLGIIDTLLSYDEITNIFTDSDLLPTINAKYYRNFISTVRNLQVNEKALKQELIDINNRLSALENANAVNNNPTEESEATNDIQV